MVASSCHNLFKAILERSEAPVSVRDTKMPQASSTKMITQSVPYCGDDFRRRFSGSHDLDRDNSPPEQRHHDGEYKFCNREVLATTSLTEICVFRQRFSLTDFSPPAKTKTASHNKKGTVRSHWGGGGGWKFSKKTTNNSLITNFATHLFLSQVPDRVRRASCRAH
jgi:hypothetical protein